MTTRVTVDAHAGWPVEVTTADVHQDGPHGSVRVAVVPSNTSQDFYVHSHLEILGVKELPRS